MYKAKTDYNCKKKYINQNVRAGISIPTSQLLMEQEIENK